MTIEELNSYGFREWPITSNVDHHDRQWQFCCRDDAGKKFFVQVRLWQFSKYGTATNPVQDGWDAWVQFNTRGEQRTFDVTVRCADLTPQQVVEWFNRVWERLECGYYEMWDKVE